MKSLAALLPLLLLPLLDVACTPQPGCVHEAVFEVGGAVLSVERCTGQLLLGDLEQPARFLGPNETGRPAVAWADDELTTDWAQGRYAWDGEYGSWRAFAEGGIEDAESWASGDGERIVWSAGPGGSVRVFVQGPEQADRVSVAFGCPDGARYYGLGARPDGTDHTGKQGVLHVAEQGIGQQDYDLDEIDLLYGRTGDSYYPVPWFVSSEGWGIAVMGDHNVEFDLCDEGGGFGSNPVTPELRLASWSNSLELLLFPTETPREAVSAYTLGLGPPAPAPQWVWGPWIASQRGTEELLELATYLREQGIPSTALWAQDWIGGRESPGGGYDLYYHWEWDPELYPDLDAAIDTLHAQGMAFLGYFNPFMTDPFPDYLQARENGWLIETADGEPYEFLIVDRFGSVVDLADEEAYRWAKQYFVAGAEQGHDGWMCDFGEWLPYDAVVGDGMSGADYHNRYPIDWHKVNMEALDQVWGAGNALCFGRSGWTGDFAITPVTWGGDQETSWERDDGIATAREIGVGLGFAGVGRYGSDIAGFSSLHDGPSTRELYWRWITMGALEPIMRTHDGLAEEANWDWREDAETVAHFKRWAQLHMRLQPFWEGLERVYETRGLPLMRHGVLVHPQDVAVRDAADQHFLGDDVLVAPVLEEGATSREVVLPAGLWYGLFDGQSYDGGRVTVDAELDTIPVFVRAGGVVPVGDPEVVTSYVASDAGVVDSGDRAERLDAWVFHGGDGSFLLADGGRFVFTSEGDARPGAPTYSDDGTNLSACTNDDDWDCVEDFDEAAGLATYRVSWATGRTVVGPGWTLELEGGGPQRGVITLRF